MALTKEQKKEIIKDLEEKIEQQKTVVFIGFQGMKVKELAELREKVKAINGEIKVVKKTLAGLVFKKKEFGINVKEMEKEVALVFGFKDPVSIIKLVYQTSIQKEKLKILAGLVEGEFLDKDKIIEIAKLPTKEELIASLIRTIYAPVSGLVNVLKGNIKGLLHVLANAKA